MFKLDMIQKLEPIDARAYAYAKQADMTSNRQQLLQTKHDGVCIKAEKKHQIRTPIRKSTVERRGPS